MTFDNDQEKAEVVAILTGATYTVTGASACALADRIRAVAAAPVVEGASHPPPAVDG